MIHEKQIILILTKDIGDSLYLSPIIFKSTLNNSKPLKYIASTERFRV